MKELVIKATCKGIMAKERFKSNLAEQLSGKIFQRKKHGGKEIIIEILLVAIGAALIIYYKDQIWELVTSVMGKSKTATDKLI